MYDEHEPEGWMDDDEPEVLDQQATLRLVERHRQEYEKLVLELKLADTERVIEAAQAENRRLALRIAEIEAAPYYGVDVEALLETIRLLQQGDKVEFTFPEAHGEPPRRGKRK